MKTMAELMREQHKKIRDAQAKVYRAGRFDKNRNRPVGKLIEHKFMQHYNAVLDQCDRDIAAEDALRNTPR